MLAGLKFEKDEQKKKKKKKEKKKAADSSSDSDGQVKGANGGRRGLSPLVTRTSQSAERPSDYFESLGTAKPKKEVFDPDKQQVYANELNPHIRGETEVVDTESGSAIPKDLMADFSGGTSIFLKRKLKRQKELAEGKLDLSTPLPLKNGRDTKEEKAVQPLSSLHERNKKIVDKYACKSSPSEPRKLGLEELVALENAEADEALYGDFPACVPSRADLPVEDSKPDKPESSRERGRDADGRGGWREKRRGERDRRKESRGDRSDDERRDSRGTRRSDKKERDSREHGEDVLQKLHKKHVRKDETQGASSSSVAKVDAGGLDANELAALAMEAMLEGDTAKHDRLTALSLRASVKGPAGSQKEQKALEEIDAAGRRKEMLQKVKAVSRREAGKLRGLTISMDKDGVQNYYHNDECTLEELNLRERVEGVQDYDANYREHILRKGADFRERDEDEDVEYALGDYEQRYAKTRKRGQDPATFVRREELREVNDAKRLRQSANKCNKCMDSDNFRKKSDIISESPTAYLCFERDALTKWQLLLVPKTHSQSITEVEEDCAAEIRNYQKSIVRAFSIHGLTPVFIETVARIEERWKLLAGGGNHTAIEVIPVPHEKASEAMIYAQKSLQEAEDWTSHKGVIECPRGARGKIPPNFPYIHLDIGLERGFAHVIEDPRLFAKGFGRAILHDVLGADRFTRAYSSQEERDAEKAKFAKIYKPLHWET